MTSGRSLNEGVKKINILRGREFKPKPFLAITPALSIKRKKGTIERVNTYNVTIGKTDYQHFLYQNGMTAIQLHNLEQRQLDDSIQGLMPSPIST